MPSIRPSVSQGVAISALFATLLASSLAAQTTTPSDSTQAPIVMDATGMEDTNVAPKKNGMKCEAPSFTFEWRGTPNTTLIATADPAQTFEVTMRYLLSSWKDPIQVPTATNSCSPPDCTKVRVRATPEGNRIPVHVDPAIILKDGGKLGFTWRHIETLDSSVCPKRIASASSEIRLMNKHTLTFDLGPVYTLEGDGSWDADTEVAASFRSRWFTWLSSGFTARYSTIGAIDESTEDEEAMDGMGSMGGMDPMGDMEEQPFNPFEQGGGTFSGDFYVALSPPQWPRFALVAGAGFSTLPDHAEGASVETRTKTFLAIRNSVLGYNAGGPAETLAGSSGFLQVGVANDKLFEEVVLQAASEDGSQPAVVSDESDRLFLEGQLELPRVGTEWMRIAVRLYASIPQSGDGPSDIRVSALASFDPRSWFGGSK